MKIIDTLKSLLRNSENQPRAVNALDITAPQDFSSKCNEIHTYPTSFRQQRAARLLDSRKTQHRSSLAYCSIDRLTIGFSLSSPASLSLFVCTTERMA